MPSLKKSSQPARRFCAITLLLVLLAPAHVPVSRAASSWSPSLLVNTEAFQTIDDQNTSANITLRFGSTVTEEILWDRTGGQFQMTDDLEVLGTMSGTALTVGSLKNCNTVDTNANGVFACGTDEGGSGGISQTDGDARYVRRAGGSMTGALQIGNAAGLNASGSLLTNTNITLNSDNQATDATLTFGNSVLAQTLKFSATNQRFEFSKDVRVTGSITAVGALSGTTLTVSGIAGNTFVLDGNSVVFDATNNRFGIGTSAPKTLLEVAGTMSGSAVTVSSLKNCDTIDTNANGVLACGTDATGGGGGGIEAHYVRAGGDTMTGGLLIESRASGTTPATIDTGLLLEVAGTMSGRMIHAQNQLRSSGGLVVQSNVLLKNMTTAPATPTAGTSLYTYDAAAEMPFARVASQRPWNLLDMRLGSHIACIVPGTGTAPVALGIPSNVTVTASHPATATTNLSTSFRRTQYATSTTAGTSTGNRAGVDMVWRGNAAGLGGFLFYTRFFVSTTTAQQRYFIGLYDTVTAIGNVNPSTLLDTVYIGIDSTQTTLRVCTNDNAGAATCTDLGANFPAATITAVYNVWFYAAPNGSNIQYFVERLDSEFTAAGTITTDLPRNTVMLAPQVWMNNGSTAAAAQLQIGGTCVASDY